jgi:hypothetical protein
VRSALQWAQVGAMAADGVSQREIAGRLGINRRTVSRMVASDEPPPDRRTQGGARCSVRSSGCCGGCLRSGRPSRRRGPPRSCASGYGYEGSGRPRASAPAAAEAAARATGSAHRLPPRAGAAAGLGGTAHPTPDPRSRATRPRAGLLLALLGRAVGPLQLRHDARVLSRGPPAALRLARGRSPRLRLRQLALGRCKRSATSSTVTRAPAPVRPLSLLRHRLHAGDAQGEGSVEGAVRHLKTGFWPGRADRIAQRPRRPIPRLARLGLQPRLARHGAVPAQERLAEERGALRPLPPARFDYAHARDRACRSMAATAARSTARPRRLCTDA